MAIIEKPINLINVANTLGYYEYKPHPVTGVNSRYVNLGRLCTHPNINKWSKWKPVRHPSKGDLTLAELKNVNFGFSIPETTTNDYTIALQGWTYNKPRGGAFNEMSRLGDFRNYARLATSPIHISQPYPFNVIGGIGDITIQVDTTTSTPYQLGLTDFDGSIISLANYYFAVIFKTPDSRFFIKTANTPLSTNNVSVPIPTTSIPFTFTSTDVYFVMSSEKIDSLVDLNSLNLTTLRPIPSDTRHYNVGVISQFNQLEQLLFSSIGTSPSGVFNSFTNYEAPNGQYFKSGGLGNAYFKATVKNNDSTAFLLEKSKLRMGLTTLVDGTGSTTMYEPSLYNFSNVAVNSVSIAPNQTVTVTIGYDGMFTNKGEVLAFPNQRATTKVRVNYYYKSNYINWVESQPILIES